MALTKTAPKHRKDPPRRRLEATGSPVVVNGDPERVYRLVHKGALDEYEQLGYEVERAGESKTGARLSVGKTVQAGEPIQYRDMQLMSIDRASWLEIEQIGASGDGGQEWADAVEKRMVDRRGGNDPLRGMPNRGGLAFTNETEESEEEELPV